MIGDKIGKRLQEQRIAKKLTQEELAEIIGVTPNYLSAVERGINLLSYEKLVSAINYIGCSADDIFCDVVEHSTKSKANNLVDRIESLSKDEKEKILDVLEIMLRSAENN